MDANDQAALKRACDKYGVEYRGALSVVKLNLTVANTALRKLLEIAVLHVDSDPDLALECRVLQEVFTLYTNRGLDKLIGTVEKQMQLSDARARKGAPECPYSRRDYDCAVTKIQGRGEKATFMALSRELLVDRETVAKYKRPPK